MFCRFDEKHLWIARDTLLMTLRREREGIVHDALRGALVRIEDKLGLRHSYPTRGERRGRKVA